MWCEDFFADEIAMELENPDDNPTENFYTYAFRNSPNQWICPNTTSILVNSTYYDFEASVISCSHSKEEDTELGKNMTPYVHNYDETCLDEAYLPDELDRFLVNTMLITDQFNPYRYFESSSVQKTTRYDG